MVKLSTKIPKANRGSYFMFLAAFLYVFSQTSFFINQKDLITALALSFFLLGVVSPLSVNARARSFLIEPSFLISSFVILLFAALSVDLENLPVILKIVILLLATTLFLNPRGLATVERYADGALLSVIIIAILAKLQVIPTEQYSAHELWQKESGGFSNPNNGPYFVYVCMLIYFIKAKLKKAYITMGLLIFLYHSDVFSRTYLVLTILLFVATLCNVKFPRLLRSLHMMVGLIALVAMLAGLYFYIGIFMYPDILQRFQGTPLDLITSYRITVALSEPVYSSDSILGFSFTRLDSLYVELIYSCGPVFLFLFFTLFVRNLFVFHPNSTETRIHLGVSAVLIAGLFEIQLFNITPVGTVIFLYVITKIKISPIFTTASDIRS